MTPSKPDVIKLRCKCGTKLEMPLSAAGRRAKCPKCAHIFVIPTPAQSPEPAQAQDDSGGMDSLLDELADEARTAPAAPQPADRSAESTCPKCKAVLPAMAVLCVHCGYDTRHAKAHRGAGAGAVGAIVGKLAVAGGTFLFGCVLSSVGALVGALVWFGIAVGANFEIGWIAWGIGALAGIGMLKGYGVPNAGAGVVAAGIALAGVLAAKLMIFFFVIYAVVSGNTNDVELQREYVKAMMADDFLDEQGVESEQERDEQWDAAYERADAIVSGYSDEETRAAWRDYKDRESEGALDLKRALLAGHYHELAAQSRGLSYNDERRNELLEQERARFKAMDEAQLDAELTRLESWRNGGKWQDTDYVRNALIYGRIDAALSALDESGADQSAEADDAGTADSESPRSPEQWRAAYTATAAGVDAMSAAERLSELQRIIHERDAASEAAFREFQEESSESETSPDASGSELVALFFQAMFSPMDAVFILLALTSAYKIGSRGSEE